MTKKNIAHRLRRNQNNERRIDNRTDGYITTGEVWKEHMKVQAAR